MSRLRSIVGRNFQVGRYEDGVGRREAPAAQFRGPSPGLDQGGILMLLRGSSAGSITANCTCSSTRTYSVLCKHSIRDGRGAFEQRVQSATRLGKRNNVADGVGPA